MSEYVSRGSLSVSADLAAFVETELLSATGLTGEQFWDGFDVKWHLLQSNVHGRKTADPEFEKCQTTPPR